jgi:hypothetical protein
VLKVLHFGIEGEVAHVNCHSIRNYEADSLKALKEVTGRVEKDRSQKLMKLAA